MSGPRLPPRVTTRIALSCWRRSAATSCTSTQSRGPARSWIPASSCGGSRRRSHFSFFLLLFFLLPGSRLRLRLRLFPVRFEHRLHFLRNTRVVDDHADLTAPVELQLPQALTADERAVR